jgi:hypothetical protein
LEFKKEGIAMGDPIEGTFSIIITRWWKILGKTRY